MSVHHPPRASGPGWISLRRHGRRIVPCVACILAAAVTGCAADGSNATDDADAAAQTGAAASEDTVRGGAAGGGDSMHVTVWLTSGEEVVPVSRQVPASADTLEAALRALLAGPTAAEREQGLTSWFSPETEDALRSARVQDGLAIVDLRDLRSVIPNASSSHGSTLLIDALNRTVFDASAADSVEYRFEGSCDTFGEFVQRGCLRYARDR